MREIKFRVWDTPAHIWLDASNNRLTFDGSSILDASGWVWNVPGRVIIEQSTGLRDKDEREIYEGDIVRHVFRKTHGFDHIGVVEWAKLRGGFIVRIKDWPDDLWQDSLPCWEIIGNIHDNPELLEASK